MNILVFSWRDPKHPLAGGAEQVMHEHMKGWVDAGHHVILFSSHFKGGKKREILDGVEVIRWGFQYFGVHIAGCWWYFFGKHKNFDLVVDQFHGIPFFTPLYIWRTPKLAILQEVAREVWLINDFPPPFNWFVGWIGYFGEPLVFLFYRRIFFMTGSHSAKQDLVKMGIPEERITIIPHGVIIQKPKVSTKEKKKTVMFLGALARDKGAEDTIEAFSLLNKMGGDWQFWVVGRAERVYLGYLKQRAEELGVTHTVFFGFVDQRKKFELLARAHVLINPSAREGWGLVNIEANAMGTPVVAYRSPGLVDSVNHGKSGILCQRNTPAELASNTFELLKNEEKYERMRKEAMGWSKQFSWKRSRNLSLALLKKVHEY